MHHPRYFVIDEISFSNYEQSYLDVAQAFFDLRPSTFVIRHFLSARQRGEHAAAPPTGATAASPPPIITSAVSSLYKVFT